jgi:hypothetical protein
VCCVLVLLAFFTPRIVLVLLWLFNQSYLNSAYETWVWPTLGFFFLPATTLAYAIAQNEFGGLGGLGVVVVLIGVAVDVGLLGGGARQRRTAG